MIIAILVAMKMGRLALRSWCAVVSNISFIGCLLTASTAVYEFISCCSCSGYALQNICCKFTVLGYVRMRSRYTATIQYCSQNVMKINLINYVPMYQEMRQSTSKSQVSIINALRMYD